MAPRITATTAAKLPALETTDPTPDMPSPGKGPVGVRSAVSVLDLEAVSSAVTEGPDPESESRTVVVSITLVMESASPEPVVRRTVVLDKLRDVPVEAVLVVVVVVVVVVLVLVLDLVDVAVVALPLGQSPLKTIFLNEKTVSPSSGVMFTNVMSLLYSKSAGPDLSYSPPKSVHGR
jgi:hypothetical protein